MILYLDQKNTKEVSTFKTKLNPNKVIGVIDADKFDEPTVVSIVMKIKPLET